MLKFPGRLWGKYLVIPPTMSKILSRAAMTFLKMSSTAVSFPRLSCIFLILSMSHSQSLMRSGTSLAIWMTLLMRLIGRRGCTRFCTNCTTLLTKSTNLLIDNGRYPANFAINLFICSAITLVILSNCLSKSSPASAMAWMRSFGKSFLKLAEALKAALPRTTSKPNLRI